MGQRGCGARAACKVFVLVAAGLVLAACSGPARPGAGSASHASPVRSSVRPAPSQTPTITDELTACQGGVPFYAASPPYTGAGPHRVIGLNLGDDSEAVPANSTIVPPDDPVFFPASWAADYQDEISDVFVLAPQEADYRHAELVLCMSLPEAIGGVLGTCSYSPEDDALGGGGFPVHIVSAAYEFKLFESRTGHLLTSFRLTSSDRYSCPAGLSSGELNLKYKIAAQPGTDAIAAKVRPFVEGPAAAG